MIRRSTRKNNEAIQIKTITSNDNLYDKKQVKRTEEIFLSINQKKTYSSTCLNESINGIGAVLTGDSDAFTHSDATILDTTTLAILSALAAKDDDDDEDDDYLRAISDIPISSSYPIITVPSSSSSSSSSSYVINSKSVSISIGIRDEATTQLRMSTFIEPRFDHLQPSTSAVGATNRRKGKKNRSVTKKNSSTVLKRKKTEDCEADVKPIVIIKTENTAIVLPKKVSHIVPMANSR